MISVSGHVQSFWASECPALSPKSALNYEAIRG
jgi:hypothetical protein